MEVEAEAVGPECVVKVKRRPLSGERATHRQGLEIYMQDRGREEIKVKGN